MKQCNDNTTYNPSYSNYINHQGKVSYWCPFEVEGIIVVEVDSAEEALKETDFFITQCLGEVQRKLSVAGEQINTTNSTEYLVRATVSGRIKVWAKSHATIAQIAAIGDEVLSKVFDSFDYFFRMGK